MRADGSTVAVVGATGYLGRCLVRACLQAGYSVRALVRPGSDVSGLVALGGREEEEDVAGREAGAGTRPAPPPPPTPAEAAGGGARLSIVRCPASTGGLPTPAQLSGTAALLVAVAGRANRTCPTAEMRAAEVSVPLSLYAAACAAAAPPARAVFFAPALDAMAAARAGRPPQSEYMTAKEEMVAGLRAAEADAVRAAAGGGGRPPHPPAITLVQVAAWGRDVDPIVAAVVHAPAWLPAVPAVVVGGGTARVAPLEESDLAARVVAGLASPADEGATLCLGGPDAVSYAALWRLAGGAAGRKVAVVRLPAWAVSGVLLPAAAGVAAVAPRAVRTGPRALAYLLRIAADAVGADLVGEERVAGKVGVADRVKQAVEAAKAGRPLSHHR